MLRFLLLACLLSAAVAQSPRYYCGTVGVIRDAEFYVITRGPGDSGYREGLVCEFIAESPSAGFLVEVHAFRVSTATFTVSSLSRTMFQGTSIRPHQRSLVTPSQALRIRLDSRGDYTWSAGVELRVRALDPLGCPPDWVSRYGSCFGTSGTSGRLNFADAQKACNSMRANLMQLPDGLPGSIGAFVRSLPSNLRTYYTWVGLTDRTSAGQYRHYWLNGDRQYITSEISCVSGGSYSTCLPRERCAAFHNKNMFYALYMDTCTDENDFICSSPPFGTSVYYSVPEGSAVIPGYRNSAFNTYWVYGIVVGVLFFVGLAIGGVYSGVRSRARARSPAGIAVVRRSFLCHMDVPPQNNVYPTPPPPPYAAVFTHPHPPPPGFVEPVPPAYEAAVAATAAAAETAGQENAGFAK